MSNTLSRKSGSVNDGWRSITYDDIVEMADDRYTLGPGACRVERMKVKHLRERFIREKMKEYGINTVNLQR